MEEQVETVRPEVSAQRDGTRMRGCRQMMLDGVQIYFLTVFRALLASSLLFPHPERRRKKDRGLINPAVPRDRGDIHERQSAGIERQTGTQREKGEREGGSAVSLSIPSVGSGSTTLSAVHYTTAERSAVSFSRTCHLAVGRTRDE